MQRTHEAGRAAPLVLELVSGTVILHGEEVELPPREFRLLAALAKRVGEPVSSAELMEVVWAEDAEWTPPHNLIVLVSKLRRLIDGPTKFGRNIRNRRRRGYVLDLDPDQVIVIEGPGDEEAADRVVYLDQSETIATPETPGTEDLKPQGKTVEDEPAEAPQQGVALPSEPRRSRRLAGVAALAVGLLATSWGTGYVLSSRDAPGAAIAEQPEDDIDHQIEKDAPSGRGGKAGKADKRDGSEGKRKNRQGRGSGSAAIAAPGTSTDDNLSDPNGTKESSQGSSETSDNDQQPAPALPPAPTRYLYHLVNPETGDHFVTTDSATASQQEARGYEGGPIARVYTYREDNTKAISTNRGTAYVFIGATPKTDPASRTIALWYSTDGAGDFFYTTIESQAKRDGWTGTRVGYVRTL